MSDFYLRSTSSTERANSTVYASGARVSIARADAQAGFATMRKYVYEATTIRGTGTTAAAPPVFPTTPGNTVDDDATPGTHGVTWTCRECQTWANAAKFMDYIGTNRLVAGDRLFVSQAHAESYAAASGIVIFPVTLTSPTQILCVNDGAEPPVALATGGMFELTGNSNLALHGAVYIYGINFKIGTGGSGAAGYLTLEGVRMTLENCTLDLQCTGQGALTLGGGSTIAAETTLIDCHFKFASTLHGVIPNGISRIQGGNVLSGSVVPPGFIAATSATESFYCLVDGFDFSNLSTGINLVAGGTMVCGGKVVFRNCKLATSWAGSLLSAALAKPGLRVEMWNCDAADTNYRLWVEDYCGSIKSETTVVMTGGSTDGTTPFSLKMVSNANAAYPLNVLRSPELFIRNETTGSAKTCTTHLVWDSATSMQNNAIWLEVQALGVSSFPLSQFTDDAKADALATAADQTTSTEAWGGTGGFSNVRKQQLDVSVTPQRKGDFVGTVCLALASKTVYVNAEMGVA